MESKPRKPSIDALRGLVMVLMALDHVRDFFAPTHFDPLDLEVTTPGWFWTRWVTHFCAPVFVFLAGTAAWYKGRKVGPPELSRWLIGRGLWLILLELVVNNTLWFASLWPKFVLLQVQVLWAIGVSLICLGVLCRLPRIWAGLFAAITILGHNLLDRYGVQPNSLEVWDVLWSILHVNHFLPINGGGFVINYPLIPWVGVMAAGWLFGGWFESWANREKSALVLGVSVCAAFVVLRYSNLYGDPSEWSSSERGELYTFFSFLNCQKYPPSLLYLAMTLGPSLVLLGLFEKLSARGLRFLVVFGRVPLFFYLLHVLVIHAAALLIGELMGRDFGWFWALALGGSVEGYEPNLAHAYLAWVLVVLALYLPCVAWGQLKKSRRYKWVDLF